MSQEYSQDYHRRRADEEEQIGRSSLQPEAARAHRHLADLHRQRAEELGPQPAPTTTTAPPPSAA